MICVPLRRYLLISCKIVAQWETKAVANVELKGRVQQILDWVYPTVVMQDKGVYIIYSFTYSYF